MENLRDIFILQKRELEQISKTKYIQRRKKSNGSAKRV